MQKKKESHTVYLWKWKQVNIAQVMISFGS